MSRERIIHAYLTAELVAPARCDSPDEIRVAEAMIFDTDLYESARQFGRFLRRELVHKLTPASMVILEQFAEQYAKETTTGEFRRQRIRYHYCIGAMVGLAAMSLRHTGPNWSEIKEVEPMVARDLSTAITYDEIPEGAIRIDPIAASTIDQLADHLAADLDDPADAALATKIGYYAARQLAALTIER